MAIYSPTNIQTEQQNDFVGVQNLSTTFKHNFEAQKQLFAQEIRVHYNLREPKGNKPTMVFLVVYINKKQIRISTGCKVYPKQWNSTRAITGITLTKLNNCNNRILNAKIDELNTRFEEYKYYICNGFAELNIKSFKSYMENKVLNQPKDKSIDIIKVMKESITKDYNIKNSTRTNYLRFVGKFEAFYNDRDPLAELTQCVLNPSDRFVVNVIDIL